MSHLDIAEKRLPQDGRIRVIVAGRDIDLRVSVIPMIHGQAVVLRILDRGGAKFGLEYLGMSPRDRTVFERILEIPHGIVLVTGPTGSGKTTTLYTALTKINDVERKIITIEDPVEVVQVTKEEQGEIGVRPSEESGDTVISAGAAGVRS